jgi:hypothetical protein
LKGITVEQTTKSLCSHKDHLQKSTDVCNNLTLYIDNSRGDGEGAEPPPFRRRIVGGYRLGQTLGKGSCGVVKLGIHITTGEKVIQASLTNAQQ